MSTEKAPYDVAQKVMLYFFDVVEKKKHTMQRDPLVQETLSILIGTLVAINAPTRIFGDVADFVLARATKGFLDLSINYEGILYSLADYVSAPMLAKIIDHFASVGRLETLTKLTSTYLHRGPSHAEVLKMAKSHCPERWRWTRPEDKIWGQLLELAHPNDVPEIKKLHEEAKRRQGISDSDIY